MQENLTPREQENFDMLVIRTSPKEIGYKLNISYKTVKYHQKKLYEKLGINSIKELLEKYSEWHPSPFKLGKDNRLVEGEIWHVTSFFEVNVDLDFLMLDFFDGYAIL